MSRKEKIDEVNGIQLHIQFCSFEKNSRYLQEYLGFGWQKNNADKSIPLPVAITGGTLIFFCNHTKDYGSGPCCEPSLTSYVVHHSKFSIYRVINLKVGKVLSLHSSMHHVNGLRSIIFYSTMFDVFYIKISLV